LEYNRIMSVPDSEKVSINVGAVDLAQIDLLVDQGFYSNRSDFFRTATRNQLTAHSSAVQQHLASRVMIMGILKYGANALERTRREGKMLDLRIVGMLALGDDVTPELALATIQNVKVIGSFRARADVKEALAGRIED
jgi:Arc/MetJ-type ribon-helix-helix transcriptional regulator